MRHFRINVELVFTDTSENEPIPQVRETVMRTLRERCHFQIESASMPIEVEQKWVPKKEHR